jgi:hypothetical protein
MLQDTKEYSFTDDQKKNAPHCLLKSNEQAAEKKVCTNFGLNIASNHNMESSSVLAQLPNLRIPSYRYYDTSNIIEMALLMAQDESIRMGYISNFWEASNRNQIPSFPRESTELYSHNDLSVSSGLISEYIRNTQIKRNSMEN